jgi:hypothetical protein
LGSKVFVPIQYTKAPNYYQMRYHPFFFAIDAPNPDETINPPAGDGLSEPPMKKCRLSYVITHDQFPSKTYTKFVI